MRTLKDKHAVVTGGGSGIGRSIALALAEAGTHVFVADIHGDAARTVAAEVEARGVRGAAFACDVSDEAQVAALCNSAYETFGRVDILCNNAGISMRPYRGIVDTTLDDWRFLFGINFWGVMHGLHIFLPRMRAQDGEKHIVNTASLAGMFPMAGHAAYSASKAAVMALTEAIASELAPLGFGVTNLCPGPVDTGLGENVAKIWSGSGLAPPAEFAPVDMVVMDRVATLPRPPVEAVGRMVCEAILENRLYLHTMPLESDMLADRIQLMYGRQTIGRGGPAGS